MIKKIQDREREKKSDFHADTKEINICAGRGRRGGEEGGIMLCG